MAKFQRLVLVCTRDRGEGKECCTASRSADVLEVFKKATKANKLKRIMRATSTGCLDQCSRGTVVSIQPDDVWYGGVTAEDVEEIIQRHVLGGEIVERLRIPSSDLTGLGSDVRSLPPLRDLRRRSDD